MQFSPVTQHVIDCFWRKRIEQTVALALLLWHLLLLTDTEKLFPGWIHDSCDVYPLFGFLSKDEAVFRLCCRLLKRSADHCQTYKGGTIRRTDGRTESGETVEIPLMQVHLTPRTGLSCSVIWDSSSRRYSTSKSSSSDCKLWSGHIAGSTDGRSHGIN